MSDTFDSETQCPYCGEPLTLEIDPTQLGSDYIEDCEVCCHPMILRLTQELQLMARREDDSPYYAQ